MAIARAGAISIAEIESKKIPSMLIPLPSAAENHQYYNALEQVDKGIAILLEQKHMSRSTLWESIQKLCREKDRLNNNFKESIHLQAEEKIVAEILRKI